MSKSKEPAEPTMADVILTSFEGQLELNLLNYLQDSLDVGIHLLQFASERGDRAHMDVEVLADVLRQITTIIPRLTKGVGPAAIAMFTPERGGNQDNDPAEAAETVALYDKTIAAADQWQAEWMERIKEARRS